jgi:hypothetical protein
VADVLVVVDETQVALLYVLLRPTQFLQLPLVLSFILPPQSLVFVVPECVVLLEEGEFVQATV